MINFKIKQLLISGILTSAISTIAVGFNAVAKEDNSEQVGFLLVGDSGYHLDYLKPKDYFSYSFQPSFCTTFPLPETRTFICTPNHFNEFRSHFLAKHQVSS